MKHLTETTIGIMNKIDAEQAWQNLPILADALEEAGYTDTDMLTALRSDEERLRGPWYRRVIESKATLAEILVSIAWMTACAEHFAKENYWYEDAEHVIPEENFNWLMEVCDRYVTIGEETCLGYDTPDYNATELWKHYEVLTGTPQPQQEDWSGETYPAHPFRCAC